MAVTLETCDGIGLIWVDNPPVNALSTVVREGIIDQLARIEADSQLTCAAIICRGRTFMAGADIAEFKTTRPGVSKGASLVAALEAFSKPIAAALHGTAFGGGLEVALACDYRIALASARIGLPEVKLGILPGGGGTQRLPRLIGLPAALDLILHGKPMAAADALACGAIDAIVEEPMDAAVVRFMRQPGREVKRRVSAMAMDVSQASPAFFDEARRRARSELRLQHAPQRIIDCLEAATRLGIEDGLAFEQAQFAACREHPQSRALQHAFFAERAAAKLPGMPAGSAPRLVGTAAVIGAGTMGGGIAMSFANAGIPVHLVDTDEARLEAGLAVVRRNYQHSVARGRLDPDTAARRISLIRAAPSCEELREVDFFVEAVFETMEIKKQVFGLMDRVAPEGAILASNTSRLSIDEMAGATRRRGDVVGTHFFSPANVMRLCEVVRGPGTSMQTLATTLDVVRRIGKVGVVSSDSDGFIGNRMIAPAKDQASLMLLEGAAPEDVDACLHEFGMAMGPFQVSDLAGLDVGYKSRRNYDASRYDPRAVAVADSLVEQGRHGQKTAAGYYDYEPGGRQPKPSALVREVIAEAARRFSIRQRQVTKDEILHRYLLAIVNTGCDVLQEGVAYRAGDIDVVYLNGYGFPAWRGGPMYWAEHEVGLPEALRRIREYAAITGERWLRPSPLLERLVAAGKGFADIDSGDFPVNPASPA